jgi:hypothetical protein
MGGTIIETESDKLMRKGVVKYEPTGYRWYPVGLLYPQIEFIKMVRAQRICAMVVRDNWRMS